MIAILLAAENLVHLNWFWRFFSAISERERERKLCNQKFARKSNEWCVWCEGKSFLLLNEIKNLTAFWFTSYDNCSSNTVFGCELSAYSSHSKDLFLSLFLSFQSLQFTQVNYQPQNESLFSLIISSSFYFLEFHLKAFNKPYSFLGAFFTCDHCKVNLFNVPDKILILSHSVRMQKWE